MTGRSEQWEKLAAALAAAQEDMPTIEPDATGQVGGGIDKVTGQKRDGRKYKYASLATVIAACRPILAKHKLAVTQTCEPGNAGTVRLTTTLMHDSGQWLSGTAELRLANDTPQGYGSAMTYARRYQYAAILGIAAEDDDDGHEGSQRPAAASGAGRQAGCPRGRGQEKPAGPTDAQRFEAMPFKDPAAKEYAAAQLRKLGYTDRDQVMKAMLARGMSGGTLVGVVLKTLPDLTGGGEPPAEAPAGLQALADEARALGITEKDVEFYGGLPQAIAAVKEAAQAAQQPAAAG